MKKANFQYKCRLCGDVTAESFAKEKNAELILIDVVYGLNNVPVNVGLKPCMVGVHYCDDGNRGVADFIGYKVEEN